MTQPALISTDQLITTLAALVKQPSSTTHPEELSTAARRIATLMRNSGLTVATLPTAGAPIVVGRRAGRTPFTLVLYHHYDSAPPGPWRTWNHDPYAIAERDSVLYGRGVAAGKGPLAAHLNALAALLDSEGELPCGITLVAEGEGLIGSPSFGAAIVDHRDQLRGDACVATAGDRDANGRPICYAGTKGMVQLRLRVDGANQPLPSGLAASVPNPLWRLLWALTQIKSDQEEILINGFYDTIEGPGRLESRALRSVSLGEDQRQHAWNISQMLFNMTGAAVVQADGSLPTCNITNIVVEPSSDIAAIPSSASARLDFQLVPNQHPQVVCDLLRDHLDGRGLADIQIERIPGGYPAFNRPIDDPFVVLLSEAGRQVHGEPLRILPRGPFALPLALLGQAYSIPITAIGLARADSAVCAPNERIPLPDLVRHGQLLIELMYACAAR